MYYILQYSHYGEPKLWQAPSLDYLRALTVLKLHAGFRPKNDRHLHSDAFRYTVDDCLSVLGCNASTIVACRGVGGLNRLRKILQKQVDYGPAFELIQNELKELKALEK